MQLVGEEEVAALLGEEFIRDPGVAGLGVVLLVCGPVLRAQSVVGSVIPLFDKSVWIVTPIKGDFGADDVSLKVIYCFSKDQEGRRFNE